MHLPSLCFNDGIHREDIQSTKELCCYVSPQPVALHVSRTKCCVRVIQLYSHYLPSLQDCFHDLNISTSSPFTGKISEGSNHVSGVSHESCDVPCTRSHPWWTCRYWSSSPQRYLEGGEERSKTCRMTQFLCEDMSYATCHISRTKM